MKRDATFGIVDGRLEFVDLTPGASMSGKLIFEAKENSSKLVLHYEPGLFQGSSISINLK